MKPLAPVFVPALAISSALKSPPVAGASPAAAAASLFLVCCTDGANVDPLPLVSSNELVAFSPTLAGGAPLSASLAPPVSLLLPLSVEFVEVTDEEAPVLPSTAPISLELLPLLPH